MKKPARTIDSLLFKAIVLGALLTFLSPITMGVGELIGSETVFVIGFLQLFSILVTPLAFLFLLGVFFLCTALLMKDDVGESPE